MIMNTNSQIATRPDQIIGGIPCYTRQGLAKSLKLSANTIAGWKSRGLGPSYLNYGRSVYYPLDEVERWLKTRIVNPDSKTV